jgi:hypothetical protein
LQLLMYISALDVAAVKKRAAQKASATDKMFLLFISNLLV